MNKGAGPRLDICVHGRVRCGDCAEIKGLREELAAAEARVKSLQSLLHDICEEWDEDCNPTCDSYGHDGDCKAVNIAAAKKALNAENAKLCERVKELLDLLVQCQERLDDGDNSDRLYCDINEAISASSRVPEAKDK